MIPSDGRWSTGSHLFLSLIAGEYIVQSDSLHALGDSPSLDLNLIVFPHYLPLVYSRVGACQVFFSVVFHLNASNCILCCRSFSSCLLCVCQCAPVAGISRRQSSSCTQYVLLHTTYNRNTSAELFACSVHSHVDTQMKRVILLLMTPTESV